METLRRPGKGEMIFLSSREYFPLMCTKYSWSPFGGRSGVPCMLSHHIRVRSSGYQEEEEKSPLLRANLERKKKSGQWKDTLGAAAKAA